MKLHLITPEFESYLNAGRPFSDIQSHYTYFEHDLPGVTEHYARLGRAIAAERPYSDCLTCRTYYPSNLPAGPERLKVGGWSQLPPSSKYAGHWYNPVHGVFPEGRAIEIELARPGLQLQYA